MWYITGIRCSATGGGGGGGGGEQGYIYGYNSWDKRQNLVSQIF